MSVDRPAPDLVDVLVAVGCLLVFTVPVLVGWESGHGPRWAIALCGVVSAGALVLRRRVPVAVLAAVGAVDCVALLTGVRYTFLVSSAGPAIGIAAFTVACQLPRRRSLAWAVAVIAATVVAGVLALNWYPDQDQNLVQLVVAAPGWMLGDAVRSRRHLRRQLAEQQAAETVEREARIRAEERVRLSRDVHDLVSHTLSMIAVRAGVGRVLAASDPAAREAFVTIEDGSRAALGELRQVLRATRDPAAGDDEPAGTPVLDDLEAMVSRAATPDLRIDLRRTGSGDYPALLQTTAYRVVQEALTNVVKHAAASRVDIDIDAEPTVLRIAVSDNGIGSVASGPTGDGLGLAGMAERVALWGGTLNTGAGPDGGFLVNAELPAGQRS